MLQKYQTFVDGLMHIVMYTEAPGNERDIINLLVILAV